VITEEPIPSWAFQETLAEILLANGFKLTNLKNGVVCPNRTDDSHFTIFTAPVSNFEARCSDGYLLAYFGFNNFARKCWQAQKGAGSFDFFWSTQRAAIYDWKPY
jgi:hypothetical protein